MSGGMSDFAVSLQIAAAFAAGGLVGWWQFPLREGLLVNNRRPAAAPLAGALVAVTTVSLVFIREAIVAAISDGWRLSDLADLLLSWLAAGVLLGVIGSFFGWVGALIAAEFARR